MCLKGEDEEVWVGKKGKKRRREKEGETKRRGSLGLSVRSETQYQGIETTVEGVAALAVIIILLGGGCRRGELLSLR